MHTSLLLTAVTAGSAAKPTFLEAFEHHVQPHPTLAKMNALQARPGNNGTSCGSPDQGIQKPFNCQEYGDTDAYCVFGNHCACSYPQFKCSGEGGYEAYPPPTFTECRVDEVCVPARPNPRDCPVPEKFYTQADYACGNTYVILNTSGGPGCAPGTFVNSTCKQATNKWRDQYIDACLGYNGVKNSPGCCLNGNFLAAYDASVSCDPAGEPKCIGLNEQSIIGNVQNICGGSLDFVNGEFVCDPLATQACVDAVNNWYDQYAAVCKRDTECCRNINFVAAKLAQQSCDGVGPPSSPSAPPQATGRCRAVGPDQQRNVFEACQGTLLQQYSGYLECASNATQQCRSAVALWDNQYTQACNGTIDEPDVSCCADENFYVARQLDVSCNNLPICNIDYSIWEETQNICGNALDYYGGELFCAATASQQCRDSVRNLYATYSDACQQGRPGCCNDINFFAAKIVDASCNGNLPPDVIPPRECDVPQSLYQKLELLCEWQFGFNGDSTDPGSQYYCLPNATRSCKEAIQSWAKGFKLGCEGDCVDPIGGCGNKSTGDPACCTDPEYRASQNLNKVCNGIGNCDSIGPSGPRALAICNGDLEVLGGLYECRPGASQDCREYVGQWAEEYYTSCKQGNYACCASPDYELSQQANRSCDRGYAPEAPFFYGNCRAVGEEPFNKAERTCGRSLAFNNGLFQCTATASQDCRTAVHLWHSAYEAACNSTDPACCTDPNNVMSKIADQSCNGLVPECKVSEAPYQQAKKICGANLIVRDGQLVCAQTASDACGDAVDAWFEAYNRACKAGDSGCCRDANYNAARIADLSCNKVFTWAGVLKVEQFEQPGCRGNGVPITITAVNDTNHAFCITEQTGGNEQYLRQDYDCNIDIVTNNLCADRYCQSCYPIGQFSTRAYDQLNFGDAGQPGKCSSFNYTDSTGAASRINQEYTLLSGKKTIEKMFNLLCIDEPYVY